MVKFEELYLNSPDYGFKFYNQRLVKLFGRMNGKNFCHTLTKADVIFSINSYISRIHVISDVPIRCEGLNFNAFKMHDLVPCLYSLINLYLTRVFGYSDDYSQILPDFKLTRFCHLPFGSDIVLPKKEPKNIQCALLDDPFGISRYCCVVGGVSVCGSSLDALLHIVSHRFSNLVKNFEIHFVSP